MLLSGLALQLKEQVCVFDIGRDRQDLGISFFDDLCVHKSTVFKIGISQQPFVFIAFLDVELQPYLLPFHKLFCESGGFLTHIYNSLDILLASLGISFEFIVIARFGRIYPDEPDAFSCGKP